MYISLKWKLVVFLSAVLVIMTTAWTWQSISNQLQDFDKKLDQTHDNQNVLITELVSDSFLRLSQFAQLIAENSVILSELDQAAATKTLQQTLESNWLSYNINLGLDYLAVYDHNNQLTEALYAPGLELDKQFQGNLDQQLNARDSNQKPYNFIYCAKACLLVVMEPFINTRGESETIVLAQNMADTVRVYFNLTKAGLGILIAEQNAGALEMAERYLPHRKLYAWAVSDVQRLFPVIRHWSEQPLQEDENSLYKVNDQHYLIKALQIPGVELQGKDALFVSVIDATQDYQAVQDNIKQGVLVGFLGLLVTEAILLFLLISPLNKLANISNALHLLPYQEFTRAVQKVTSRRSLFPDELSTLEASTAHVAEELDKLHIEINEKNISLQEQINALTRSRSFLTRLFDNAQIFIITQDYNFNILSTNKKFDALYSHKPKKFSQLLSSDLEADTFKQEIFSLQSKQQLVFQQEIHQVDKNSNELVIAWTHALVENEQGEEIILSIGMDQTLQKRAEHDLRWMANHDSLTGLGNRRFFNSAFAQMLNTDAHGALVFIDVNRFKQINDIYGHSVGDQVLVNIAQKLRDLLRSSDVICRFAGDEFTAILANTEAHVVPSLLEKIARELSGHIVIDSGKSISYSVSIGASIFPDHGKDSQSLVINADMAMYNAKRKGFGHWHLFDEEDEQVVQLKNDKSLILSIKSALKDHSFKLVYQPIVNMHTGALSHHEVLLRMYDEDGDMVSPGLFIPVAERSGEIRKIDEWVLDKAMQQLSVFVDAGDDYKFAVNISAPTMQADDFPQMVIDSIEKYAVSPERLIIELTETAYIENFQQVLRNLKMVTGLGVKVALDDFGVGFSSFTHLKKLPLSYVKLDGSYVQNLKDNPNDQVFVRSLAAIIDAYDMHTIAEFVEDEETLQLLASLGVTYGQGYHIGRPGEIAQRAIKRARP